MEPEEILEAITSHPDNAGDTTEWSTPEILTVWPNGATKVRMRSTDWTVEEILYVTKREDGTYKINLPA